jgi:hypothetical protein
MGDTIKLEFQAKCRGSEKMKHVFKVLNHVYQKNPNQGH